MTSAPTALGKDTVNERYNEAMFIKNAQIDVVEKIIGELDEAQE